MAAMLARSLSSSLRAIWFWLRSVRLWARPETQMVVLDGFCAMRASQSQISAGSLDFANILTRSASWRCDAYHRHSIKDK